MLKIIIHVIICCMKKGVLIFLIGLSVCVFQQFNIAFASELTDDYFDIATNYFNEKKDDKALEYLEDILAVEPSNAKALELKNKIMAMYNPSQEEPEVAATPEPQSCPESPKVVSMEEKAENFTILKVQQADTEKMDYNSDYYNKMGQELYQKKEFDKANEYFYKAIKLNPKNQQAYNNLAMSYWFKNQYMLAIKFFKKSYSINKCYTQPLVNLSLLYKQLGDERRQLACLRAAVNHNPNDYWAYYLLGEYYKSKEQFPQAIVNYKEVVKINQNFAQTYLGLAMCFFETEEFNYALIALNQYIELVPNSDFAYFMMARTNLVLCRYDEAKENVLKAIEICDKNEYEFELGKIDYYLNDYAGALAVFQKLLEKAPNAELYNYLGLSNYKLKNTDVAITNFNTAIQMDGHRPIYYYNLAQCYKSMGDKKSYSKNVTAATKITPINYQDFIDLSYIYYDNGNPSYAVNTLDDAINHYPNIKALYLAKLKIYESLGDNLHYNEVKDLINERFNK